MNRGIAQIHCAIPLACFLAKEVPLNELRGKGEFDK